MSQALPSARVADFYVWLDQSAVYSYSIDGTPLALILTARVREADEEATLASLWTDELRTTNFHSNDGRVRSYYGQGFGGTLQLSVYPDVPVTAIQVSRGRP